MFKQLQVFLSSLSITLWVPAQEGATGYKFSHHSVKALSYRKYPE